MIQKLQNAHPAISLRAAYDRIMMASKTLESGVAFGRESLLKAMGFKRITGTAENVAGSLVHFGLLKRVEGGYVIPRQIKELLEMQTGSEEWERKAKPLAINPELYRYVFNKYRANLPKNLGSDLIKKYGTRNVKPKNTQIIIGNYLDSLAFAGYSVSTRPDVGSRVDESQLSVLLDGDIVNISIKYIREAYKKTLKDDLKRIEATLKSLE